MSRHVTLIDRFYRLRGRYYRHKRLLFPSPAETKFIEVMGGKVLSLKGIKAKDTGHPLAIVYRKGKILRDAKMHREVRFGKYYVDFANDLNWIIEVDGSIYHMDVVADMDREIYINELVRRSPYGMRLLRIRAPRLWNDPDRVHRDVLKYLIN